MIWGFNVGGPSDTCSMNAMVAASDEQMKTLDALVEMARDAERSVNAMQAARDGVLALASRLAMSMVEEQGDADEADLTVRTVAAELAAALRVSDRTVQRRMADAEVKVDRFPAVWQAQGAGRISAGHTRVIVDAGMHIEDPDARAAFAARVLEFAEDESPNRLRPIAERLAEQYQSRSLEERHQQAREKRSVWAKEHPDGMAELGIFGPAALVHGAHDRLTQMEKALTAAHKQNADADSGAGEDCGEGPVADPRTLGQKRADLALDLLLTGAPAGHDTPDGMLAAITPVVTVTVPALTLMGATGIESPAAELEGRSPIDAGTARLLAGAATGWDRVLTHPISGGLLAVDRYRPGEHLKRHLRARDQRCRFPGCGMPARNDDLDHTKDAALGGPTSDDNLAALCRRHHVLKHQTPWHVTQIDDGLLKWTSPTGHVYTDKPPPQNTVTITLEGTDASSVRDEGQRTGAAGSTGNSTPPDVWDECPDALRAPF